LPEGPASEALFSRRLSTPAKAGAHGTTRTALGSGKRRSVGEIELSHLAAVTRVDPNDTRRTPFDGGEQHLALAGGARNRGQPAQPSFGMAGIAVGVYEAPMRLGTIDPLIDLLPNRGVEAAIALGKAADPELSVATGHPRHRDTGEVELRGGAPTDTTGDSR